MAFSIIPGTNSSSSIVFQPSASVPSADARMGFCAKMNQCILKVMTAVRNFFAWILLCCPTQTPHPTLSAPAATAISVVSNASTEELLNGLESTEDPEEMRNALDTETEEARAHNPSEDFSDPELEYSAAFEAEQPPSFFNKGVKFISKNGNQLLSKVTGIKTEYVTPAMGYLVHSVDAARRGKYKLAAAAGMSSVSAMLLAGTNLFIPREVRELNRLTTYVNPSV